MAGKNSYGFRWPQRAPDYTHLTTQKSKKKGSKSTLLISFFVVASFLVAIVLEGLVVAGCGASIKGLYLTEITNKDTPDISLRVGYLGGCMSLSGKNLPRDDQEDRTSKKEVELFCDQLMVSKDVDDAIEEMSEQFTDIYNKNRRQAEEHVKELKVLVTAASHLQKEFFHYGYPLAYIVLFALGGIMLIVSATASSKKRTYKAALVIGVLVSGLAFAIALSNVLSYRGVINAFVEKGPLNSNSVGPRQNNKTTAPISYHRNETFWLFQCAVLSLTTLFYVILSVAFIRRG